MKYKIFLTNIMLYLNYTFPIHFVGNDTVLKIWYDY